MLATRDVLMLAAFWVAAFWALDPLQLRVDYRAVWKHVPLLLFVVALTFSLMCRQLESRPIAVQRDAFVSTTPLLLLALWIVAGSMIQRASSLIDNSFLNMGLTMPMAAATAWAVLASRSPWRWIDACVLGMAVVAFATGCVQVAEFGQVDVLHGREFLIAPFAVYAALRFPRRWLGWTLAACFIAFALAAKKNTAYLTLMLIAFYAAVMVVRAAWPRMDAAQRSLLILAGVTALVLLAALLAFVLARRDEYLPTGNTSFRSFTYWRAWTKFLGSPVFGTGFAGPSSEYFPLYMVESDTQTLPTHSDVLDVLANGGVLGFALWVGGMVWMLGGGLRLALSARPLPHRERALVHFANVSALCALLTCLFNPVLQFPNTSWMFWALFGVAAVMPRLLAAGSPRSVSKERLRRDFPPIAGSRPHRRTREA